MDGERAYNLRVLAGAAVPTTSIVYSWVLQKWCNDVSIRLCCSKMRELHK